MYMQRLTHPVPNDWRCQILPNRTIVSASPSDSAISLKLSGADSEDLEVDYAFAATGYVRDVHERILEGTRELLLSETGREGCSNGEKKGKFEVGRDYRVLFNEEVVDSQRAGVWLQGCCEGSHGLSDTLLSVLAVRGGEVVESMFGEERVVRGEAGREL